MRLRRAALLLIAASAVLVPVAAPALAGTAVVSGPVRPAAAHALIQGSGSSWAANAVNQWIGDVHANGLQVVFTSEGSAQGRKDFANNTTDYGVSDIGFQGTDPATGASDTNNGRAYAYLPIVAGGTSFPYQVHGRNGKLMTNIRLSGQTLTKIFTNKIRFWDDPAIVADNNGNTLLPHTAIIPVVHSEGSGSSYQFTAYMARQYPALWDPFGGKNPTEYFQRQGSQVSEDGSDGVINFVTSAAADGAIGYDEYSYALNVGYPVAKIENSAGYFTLPNQYNVAVALTQAQINQDKGSSNYLLQNLNNVYSYSDKRTYPISSYSYMIIPTAATDSRMTTAKRQTLADYLYYSICQGQQEMGPIGYSPLPINLVQAGFSQIALLHKADGKVDLNSENVTTCHNPTFESGNPNANYLAKVAPNPPSCDRAGAGPCTTTGSTGQKNPGTTGTVADTGDTTANSGTSGVSAAGAGGTGGSGTSGGGAAGATGSGTGAGIKSGTNKSGTSNGSAGTTTGTSNGSTLAGQATPLETTIAGNKSSGTYVVAALCALLILALVVVPPLAGRAGARRIGRP